MGMINISTDSTEVLKNDSYIITSTITLCDECVCLEYLVCMVSLNLYNYIWHSERIKNVAMFFPPLINMIAWAIGN